MKNFMFTIVCLALALASEGQTNQLQKFQTLDGYAAKVNDRVITVGEVWDAMAPYLPNIYKNSTSEEQAAAEIERYFLMMLDTQIDQALIISAYEKSGTELPEQYVKAEIEGIIQSRYAGDEAAFEEALALQRKTRAEYTKDVRDQLVIRVMRNEEVTRRARVTPKQIREYYDAHSDEFMVPSSVKYSAIILNKGTTAEEQQVKLTEAQNLQTKLVEGADFAKTAQAVSEGSQAAEGGSFPWIPLEESKPETLRDALDLLPVGAISPVIDAGTLLYIVKMEGRREAGVLAFEEVREELEHYLKLQEQDRLFNQWIERLKKDSYVKIYAQ